jgi:SagB-type dehydrogenase family enzyme
MTDIDHATPPRSVRLLYRFNKDVQSARREGNRLTLDVRNWKALAFTAPHAAYADAVLALQGGATLEQLQEIAGTSGNAAEARKAVGYYIERFARGRLLSWDLVDGSGELCSIESAAAGYRPREEDPPAGDLSLCRFAYLRRSDGGALLKSALVRARVRLGARGLAALAGSFARAGRDEFAEAMWRLGFFSPVGLEESEVRRCWEFHDLLMHESSRDSRDTAAVGATLRFNGKFASLPEIKPAMTGERVGLPAVDPARIGQLSASLDAVQGHRRSIRSYAEAAIPLATLSEFLWRVCRTTGHDAKHGIISRPYPAGGSLHELEFYLAVRRCDGLAPAVYHYDSHGHALVAMAGSDKLAAKIVGQSAQAMALGPEVRHPDLIVVIAARLPRLAWKYEGMAYRLSLLNAGVVFELMYLVATDMKLAPCANGSGDSRLLQEATGLDPLEETAIAEFALGLPAEDLEA